MHLIACKCLRPIWACFIRMCNMHKPHTNPSSELIYLGCIDGVGLMPALNASHKVMWKYVICSLAGVDLEGRPFCEKGTRFLMTTRLLVLMRKHAHGTLQRLRLMRARGVHNDEIIHSNIILQTVLAGLS